MGYRSDAAIYLPEKAMDVVSDEFKASLKKLWNEDEKHKGVWHLSGWKWYDEYDEVALCNEAISTLMDANFDKDYDDDGYINWDFIRIGDDLEDVEIETYLKFSLKREIDIWE